MPLGGHLKKPTHCERAELAEKTLGSPFDHSSLYNFKQIMEDDEQEIFKEERVKFLNHAKMHRLFIPKSSGGDLHGFDSILEWVKAVGRRDMTALVSFGKNFLGSLPIFMFGDEALRKKAYEVLEQDGYISLALTEKSNGSDLLSTKTQAVKNGDDWVISGKKWLVNNLEISDLSVVLARTNPAGGMLGFGLFVVNMKNQKSGQIKREGKIKTLGVKGMLMGAVEFQDYSCHGLAHLGEKDGFQKTLKLFQVSRSVCAGLALGSVETSLRLTTEFCLKRELYGKSISEAPIVQHRLAESYVRFMASDIALYFCARAISFFPLELSVSSAFAKYFIPMECENIMKDLSVSFGARYYLREGWFNGFFQKALRDVALISLFDGSTQVNLYIIANQLPQLLSNEESITSEASENLGRCFDFESECPEVDTSGLQLTNRGLNTLVLGLWDDSLGEEAEALRSVYRKISTDLKNDPSEINRFYLAKQYCVLMTAICVVWSQKVKKNLSANTYKYLLNILLSDLGHEEKMKNGHESIFQELKDLIKNDQSLGVLKYRVATFYNADKETDFV